jgi:hypothetical protein
MHQITIRKCQILGNKILSRGEPETLSLAKLVEKFAQSGSRVAKLNILALRAGDYVGLSTSKTESGHPSSFVLFNNGSNDISKMLKNNPGFETKILEIYRADDVTIIKNIQDLTPSS